MTDQFSRDRSERLVRFYEVYRSALDATPVGGEFMPYRWWTLPSPPNPAGTAYSQMLGEYETELANIINDLTNHVHRLRAWDTVLAGFDDTHKQEVRHEFIDTLGTVVLGQPYAIKSQFAFRSDIYPIRQTKPQTGGIGRTSFQTRTSTSTTSSPMRRSGKGTGSSS
jgi:hypothetical protein